MGEEFNEQQGRPSDDAAIRALYRAMLDAWNRRSGDDFAAAFAEDGESIGFDGSEIVGRAEIASTLMRIFADHPTGVYVSKVSSVRPLGADVAMLRAMVGIIPAGQSDLNPSLNAIQTVVATRRGGQWRIALLQNTPAQLHGRPDLAQGMTDELRQLMRQD